jgi:hypothetical protein
MAPATNEQLLDALSAPIGDLIAEVGRSVAEAQQAMDARTIENVRALVEASDPDDPLRLLRQVGYQPTWYQIPEVTAELTVALTLTGSGSSAGGAGGRPRLLAAPVDATYANRYGYELKAASIVKFRIVPVPPSPEAERLRVVPALVGLTFGQAKARLDELDVPWRLPEGLTPPADQAPVKTQAPPAGELLTGDSSVELGF